jgi:hypothetical protein
VTCAARTKLVKWRCSESADLAWAGEAVERAVTLKGKPTSSPRLMRSMGSRNLGKDIGNLFNKALPCKQLFHQQDGSTHHGDSADNQLETVQLAGTLD